MKRTIMLIAATAFVLVTKPVIAYADELPAAGTAEIIQEDDMAGSPLPVDEADSVAADHGEITAIETPDKTRISIPFKRALDVVLEELPATLTVHSGDRKEIINVRWECEGDYNERMGEYPFLPDLNGYKIADGVEVPRIIVTFDKEVANGPKGHVPDPSVRREVPFVEEEAGPGGAVAIPSYFNSYKDGKLPKVRDQEGTGTCWAHSAIGAIEADLIHRNMADTGIDLSEIHLAYFYTHGYKDPKGCRTDTVKITGPGSYLQEGQNEDDSQRVFANLVGAVDEEVAPFTEDPDWFEPNPDDIVSKDKAQVRNVYFINHKDTKAIKRAVMDHGGVSFCYYEGDEKKGERYYNDKNAAYYCTKEVTGGNHAVLIVGWDDGFSRKKFNVDPGADGAWLIRNSWGDDNYSHSGYFWLSYKDKGFAGGEEELPLVAVDASTDIYKNCYAYDGTPLESDRTFDLKPDETILVKYDVDGNETVKAVNIELISANAKVDVKVKNMSTGETVSGSVKTTTAGIYTIVLDKPLEIKQKSTVQIRISAGSDTGKVVFASENTGDLENVSFTYVRVCDKGFDYGNGEHIKYDLRVKLYTDDSKGKNIKVTGVSLDKAAAGKKAGGSFRLVATVEPKDATNKAVKWSSSNKKVATVSSKGLVRAISPGKATIKVTTEDQEKTAECKVTVKGTKVKNVKIKSKVTLDKGKSVTLKPVFSPKKATNKKVTWKSSNTKVATVSSKGKVKGVKKGKAKITVTTQDGKKKATCKVTVR